MRLAPLLLLTRPARPPVVGGDRSIVVLALVSLAMWIGLDWLASDTDSQFYLESAPYLGWFLLGGLLVAWVAARRSFPHVPYRSILLVVAALAPILILAGWLIATYVPVPWALLGELILSAYALAVLANALAWMTGRSQWLAVISVAIVAAIFASATVRLGISGAVWYVTDADSVADGDAEALDADGVAAERVLFSQQGRLDAALAHVARSEPDSPVAHTFFVGFAGVAQQHVFAEEIKLASRVAAARYAAADRTLLLLNDRRDPDGAPLASVTNLRYALRGIAARMNLDRDVLFLALSSHGGDDPVLAVENGTVPLVPVTADDLAAALKDSGIRWKVIVISSCYAGGFIPQLRDDHTVVIAAAAADRTSFGCSDDRDLTYFGEAFYRDALPGARSLREAFAATTQSIAAREAAEHFVPSRPQAYFGVAMDGKLAEIERRAVAH